MNKIKISFIAVIALFIGIAGSAFISTSNPTSGEPSYYFQFDKSTNPEEANVTDVSNWHQVAQALGCTSKNQKACIIRVLESQTVDQGLGQPRLLDPNLVINVAEYASSDVYYVVSSPGIQEIINTNK